MKKTTKQTVNWRTILSKMSDDKKAQEVADAWRKEFPRRRAMVVELE